MNVILHLCILQNQNLPQAPIHNQAHVPAPQQMESIGGTTYFYTQQAQQQPAVVRILLSSENKPLDPQLLSKLMYM